MTRGPLPARVYWVRRLMVLGTAFLLVFATGRLLTDGSDGSDGSADDTARLSAETPSSSAPTTPGTQSTAGAEATSPATATNRPRQKRTSEAPVLPAPTGTCVGSDIVVEPRVRNAVAGRDVLVKLELRTISSEACTWRVGPESLTVNLTSGSDRIWTSRDCPRAIVRRDVVVRKQFPTKVGVIWKQAKRSGEGCTARTGWAMPGWYHVTAAALGGEPSDLQFELTTPTATTITKTATPTQSPSGKPTQTKPGTKPSSQSGNQSGSQSGNQSGTKPRRTPGGSPSGAVEPD